MHSRQTAEKIRSMSAEDHLAVRERHLEVELGDLLDAVGPQVLVPEAAGDLVVALEAGDDEQLLEDLRRLREREEAAGLEALGTRKSRAPSGVGFAMIGVSISTKPAASISRRMIEIICARMRMLCWRRCRRRSIHR